MGVIGTGGSGSPGIRGTGGSGGAPGVDAIGTSNAPGLTALGNGPGAGVVGTGGTGGGPGLKGIAGTGGVGIECGAGNMTFTGTQPVKTADPGANNYMSATNVCKAWGIITLVSGTITLVDGYNIATVTATATDLTITFARNMATVNYAPVASFSGAYVPQIVIAGANQFAMQIINTPIGGANNQVAPNFINTTVFVHVFGRQ